MLGNKSCLQNCITECRDTQKRNTTLSRRVSANVFLDRARGYNEIEDDIFILFYLSQTKDKLFYYILNSDFALSMAATETSLPLSIFAISLIRSSSESCTILLTIPFEDSSLNT